jgi:hypothetical protein
LHNRRHFIAGAAALPFLANAPRAQVTIFEAASIITMEPSMPRARFIAVAGDLILGLADRLDDLGGLTNGQKPVVDRRFANKIIMPGLIPPDIGSGDAKPALHRA